MLGNGPLEFNASIADVVQPVLAVLGEAVRQQIAHPPRRPRRQQPEVRLLVQRRPDRIRDRLAPERHRPRQHLVQHAPETEDVRPLVDRLPADRAGVEHHQIGFLEIVDKGIADARQLGLDGVGVVFVHLAAIGPDIKGFGLFHGVDCTERDVFFPVKSEFSWQKGPNFV